MREVRLSTSILLPPLPMNVYAISSSVLFCGSFGNTKPNIVDRAPFAFVTSVCTRAADSAAKEAGSLMALTCSSSARLTGISAAAEVTKDKKLEICKCK